MQNIDPPTGPYMLKIKKHNYILRETSKTYSTQLKTSQA